MAGATSGNPNTRHSADLGHKQDDESGLIYMRARYYEPATGRFISQDSALDGPNWYAYSKNCPTRFVDFDGKSADDIWTAAHAIYAGVQLVVLVSVMRQGYAAYLIGVSGLAFLVSWFGGGRDSYEGDPYKGLAMTLFVTTLAFTQGIAADAMASEALKSSIGQRLKAAAIAYGVILTLFLRLELAIY